MTHTSNKTRGNSKLLYALTGLIVAVAALNIGAENAQKPAKTTDNKTPSYLKNCALKTALEHPRD